MNHKQIVILLLIKVVSLAACASNPKRPQRTFIDSTTHDNSPPAWVTATRLSWEHEGRVYIKAQHTVRGDERVNGCFDLAKLDAKESLLSEMSNEVRGSLDNAQQSISESAELVLGKVRSEEFQGRLSGLRFVEEYFERYQIGETERVDCFSLAAIEKSDYTRLKDTIVSGLIAADPRLKEALTKKQVHFLSNRIPATKALEEDKTN